MEQRKGGESMRHTYSVWVVGGDQRQARLAELLAGAGHTVYTFGLERAGALEGVEARTELSEAGESDCVVLPLPAMGEKSTLNAPLSEQKYPMEEILTAIGSGPAVCAGRVDPPFQELADRLGVTLHDYAAREEFAVANAVPTAEGALQLAMEELPVTLHGARVLVIGFGRLGRALAPRLSALGARVTVAARKWSDLAWIKVSGWEGEHSGQLKGWLCAYDLIINTVPALILDEGCLHDLKPGCLVLDLASKPGGVDFDAARRLGVPAIWALSLPGKVAPVTAGVIVRDTVCHILDELGV